MMTTDRFIDQRSAMKVSLKNQEVGGCTLLKAYSKVKSRIGSHIGQSPYQSPYVDSHVTNNRLTNMHKGKAKFISNSKYSILPNLISINLSKVKKISKRVNPKSFSQNSKERVSALSARRANEIYSVSD